MAGEAILRIDIDIGGSRIALPQVDGRVGWRLREGWGIDTEDEGRGTAVSAIRRCR